MHCVPAVTDPPGELMYMVMSLWFMESKYSSWATSRLLLSSSTAPPRRTILCSTCGQYCGESGGI